MRRRLKRLSEGETPRSGVGRFRPQFEVGSSIYVAEEGREFPLGFGARPDARGHTDAPLPPAADTQLDRRSLRDASAVHVELLALHLLGNAFPLKGFWAVR